MDIFFTWFNSDLVHLTLPLVVLGALFPWKREHDRDNWIIVAAFSGGWVVLWLLYRLLYRMVLAFVCLLMTGVLFVMAGRLLRFLLSRRRR